MNYGKSNTMSSSPSPMGTNLLTARSRVTASTEHEHQRPSRHERASQRGLLGSLRRGLQLVHDLLSPNPNLRSQMPYQSPRFVDPLASWHLAVDWLSRIIRQLSIRELSVPIFDRHGCFDRLELRRLASADGCFEEEGDDRINGGKKRHHQPQQEHPLPQQLCDRILCLVGSGDLLKALSEHLLEPAEFGPACSSSRGDRRCEVPAPGRNLLQLPLTFDATAGYQQHRSHQHHPLGLPVHPHYHLQQAHLQPEAQAALARCEKNFATFHRFLARVLTGSDSASDEASGTWDLRLLLGKQCAECNAAYLLLRNQQQQQHLQPMQLAHHPASRPKQRKQKSASPLDSALSVLLLHLLTIMLLVDDPMPQKQRSEVLSLWENRLESAGILHHSPTVKRIRSRYAQLVS